MTTPLLRRFTVMLWVFMLAAAAPAYAQEAAALVFDLRGHTGPLRRLAVDPGGRSVVTASDDKTALVWDIATGALLHTLRVPVGEDEVGRLYGAAITPDGRTVAVAGTSGPLQRIYLFDLASGAFRSAFDARGGAVRNLAWSADGALLAAAYVGKPALRVFGADGRLVHETPLAADAYGLSISKAGQLAVSSFDGRVRLFRLAAGGVVAEGEIAASLPDPVGVRHSPDGALLAVGYFSRAPGGVRVDLFDAASRQRVRSLEFNDVALGNLMNVGWQADGRALYAAGTGYSDAGRFVAKRISWPDGSADGAPIAADSVLDLAALPDGRMAFASFDGTWGLLDGLRVVSRSASPLPRIANAGALKISPDATGVEWRTADGATFSFALANRHAGEGNSAAKLAPNPSNLFGLRVSDWENTRAPKVGGRAVELLANESSRASAVLPDGNSVVLGTSRALRRYDRNGQPAWAVPLATETRAVNVSADGRIVVAALADGTLRWRRADDGALLLSLLLLRDGRWVAWTEAGYFDAGPGAEDLVGWLVARPGGERADYFGVSRFRDRYLRPDVIDRVLAERDPARALALANEQRLAQAREAEPEVIKTIQAGLAPLPVSQALPPVVTLVQVPKLETVNAEVALDLKLFAPSGEAVPKLTVRVDGRPVEATIKQLPSTIPGNESDVRMIVALPKSEGKIQIFAEGVNGISMPAELEFKSSAPALKQLADRRPTLYLLSVGVSRYANPEFNLGLAAKDAQDFARSMERQQGLYYRRVDARVLVDAEATRANVLQGLRWLQNVTTPDDVAILFVAGHGVADAADVYHFLPHDMKENQLAQSAVSEGQLRSTLAAIKGRALFFVDTCFSGKSVGKFTRRELTRMANGLASAELGVIVFSGSAPRQESLEDPAWGNGAFTKALVEGLSGRADFRREGLVTHKGLDYYVAHEVRTLTQGRQTPVTAVPNGISDFPLAAVSAALNDNARGASR